MPQQSSPETMLGAASPVDGGMPPTAPQGPKPRPRRKVAEAEANVSIAATALVARSTLRQPVETSKAGSADVENLSYTTKAPNVVGRAKSSRKRVHSDSESLIRAGADVNEDVPLTSIKAPPAKKTKKLATVSAKRDNAATTNAPGRRTSTRGQEAHALQLTGMANIGGTTIITDPVGSMSVEDVADDDEAEQSDRDDEPSALTQEQELGQDDEAQSDSGEESECDDAHKLAARLVAEIPVWYEMSKSKKQPSETLTAGGNESHENTRLVPARSSTRRVSPKYFVETSDSGSEFNPEADGTELPSEEYTVGMGEEEVDVADLVLPIVGAPGKPKNKQATGKKTAKQQLEEPVWKDAPSQAAVMAYNVYLQTLASLGIPASEAPPPPSSLPVSAKTQPAPSKASTSRRHQRPAVTSEATPSLAQESPVAAPLMDPRMGLEADEYKIVAPTPGAALALQRQHDDIRETIRHSRGEIEAFIVFIHAFPDTMGRTRFVSDALINSAGELGFPGLRQRLQKDQEFTHALSAIPRQRISTFRGQMKKCAETHVVPQFGLVQGECEAKVEFLFDHMAYVYPCIYDTKKQSVTWVQPYGGSIVTALARHIAWTGPSAIAIRNPLQFTSSIHESPQVNEKEIPMPMLALIGAAIHAALTEWKSGTHKPSSFSADAYADAYNEHLTLLRGIKDKNLRGYHKMTHRIFLAASGTAPAIPAAPTNAATDALAHVDFDNMDID
ncbi:hypothetical protein DICSQDRAFT_170686 [Dichomitus squalens LYAD-421 SS1]|uniref:DUF6532 domain-containing protein n=1 Tax=Dichomitus squalens (strain LYAD-421) TaxID=732165 RepID=R7SXK2_DICSQ|nr:uncharacterized protein DICSQDRAFT_170686 [Dichomitus squalens LYAD-421 SS1]EJF60826.1 hypothetical protein DICSQDRAFT_170686 [Dichomitus squalens LYAD-421 SS1]